MDYTRNPYLTTRGCAMAPHGMVATSQPLAAQAGLAILRDGGNAVDAAIATAIALTVVEPTSNGIGGDAFALIWDGSQLHGLNGSGRSPAAASLEALHALGYDSIPALGWPAVTVPGAPSAWAEAHRKFGRLPFARLFESAIRYAAEGFPVSPMTARGWGRAAEIYAAAYGDSGSPLAASLRDVRGAGGDTNTWSNTFTRNGLAPAPGDWWNCPDQAVTLRVLADSNCADFYTGDLARRLVEYAHAGGGWLTADDLAAHQSDWVDPLSVTFEGLTLWELPPNGQGLVALQATGILNGIDLPSERETLAAYHLGIEAIKRAFDDAGTAIADPDSMHYAPVDFLMPRHLAQLAESIDPTRAIPGGSARNPGGTVYLCTADSDGMMVSWIQSNYMGFGSGLVVPGTGIALQNRGHGFLLDPAHPNSLAPSKRPFHTIIPGFLTRDGDPVGPFGVMGGHMQPQGHLQMVLNLAHHDLNPQAALDAPRWRWDQGNAVAVEAHADPAIIAELRAMGHDVTVEPASVQFGRGQMILRLPGGGYVAGSDSRADGQAVGY
ncbi:MAG: gamma-glutamyltransferase family protein [bacterium]